MDLKEIKALMTAMEEQGIKKLEIKDDKKGVEIKLERESAHVLTHGYSSEEMARFIPSTQSVPLSKEKAAEKENVDYVASPMVGTFYSRPSSEEPPFVKVGDLVEENTIICIIEAMKVMNEVKAGKRGMVGAILIDDAHPVDFGTNLFELTEEK